MAPHRPRGGREAARLRVPERGRIYRQHKEGDRPSRSPTGPLLGRLRYRPIGTLVLQREEVRRYPLGPHPTGKMRLQP